MSSAEPPPVDPREGADDDAEVLRDESRGLAALAPDAALPLAILTPQTYELSWELKELTKECTPQALLRDLHRPVKEFLIGAWELKQWREWDPGGRGVMAEVKGTIHANYTIHIERELDHFGARRSATAWWRGEIGRAMTQPYKSTRRRRTDTPPEE